MRIVVLFGACVALAMGQSEQAAPTDPAIEAAGSRLAKRLQASFGAARAEPLAGSDSPVFRQHVVRWPFEWSLTTGDCSLLLSATRGSGTGRSTFTLAKNPNGSNNYAVYEEANGIATDNLGHKYMFIWTATTYVDSNYGIPVPNLPTSIYGPDTFQLIPVNGGASYTVGSYLKGRIRSDGSFLNQGSVATPHRECGPF